MPHFEYEKRCIDRGFRYVAGIDEVGRGPVAGPVVAAAVVLNPEEIPEGIRDSKTLSAHQRERIFAPILEKAWSIGVGFASVEEIERLNIRGATHQAMIRAYRALSVHPVYGLVDGSDLPKELEGQGESLVKGDQHSLSIAAASIIAKVIRDRLMKQLARFYPDYGFERHAGYGTLEHLKALKTFGACPYHRRGFSPLKEMEKEKELARKKPTGISLGEMSSQS